MIEEEADAAAFFAGREDEIERPHDAQWPDWSGYIQAAFHELRDDRFYGAMGGLGRIYFSAIDAYAQRCGIGAEIFDQFLTFMRAIDDEYVAVMTERAKAEMEKNKKS